MMESGRRLFNTQTNTYEENTGQRPCLSLFPWAANDQTKASRMERKGGETNRIFLARGQAGSRSGRGRLSYYLIFIFVTSWVLFSCVCIAVLYILVVRLLARSQYPEGPTKRHIGTRFSFFPCVYKRMLSLFPRLQVATACFSCSHLDLNFFDPYFISISMRYNQCHWATAHLQLNILLFYYYSYFNLYIFSFP